MKKSLIAITLGLGLTLGLNAQDYHIETNPYRFIPRSADWRDVFKYDINGDGTTDIFWWDKNPNRRKETDELFYEMNDDEIPDYNHEEFLEWRRGQEEPKIEPIEPKGVSL